MDPYVRRNLAFALTLSNTAAFIYQILLQIPVSVVVAHWRLTLTSCSDCGVVEVGMILELQSPLSRQQPSIFATNITHPEPDVAVEVA